MLVRFVSRSQSRHSGCVILVAVYLVAVCCGVTGILGRSVFLPAPLSPLVLPPSAKEARRVQLAASVAEDNGIEEKAASGADDSRVEEDFLQADAETSGPKGFFPPDVDPELLGLALTLGVITGLAVAAFKISIATVTGVLYAGAIASQPSSFRQLGWYVCLIPALGGLGVTVVRFLAGGTFGPSLAEHVSEVERRVPPRPVASLARTAAAVITLGTGNALGPEGPSVELGVTLSRILCSIFPTSQRRRRQLLAAGAAAGVAAGFNAPLTGVFFALEIVPDALAAAVDQRYVGVQGGESYDSERKRQAEFDVKSRPAIAAVSVCAIFAAVVVQEILGSELALRPLMLPLDALRSPLVQLPLYLVLGIFAGGVAATFKAATASAQWLFAEGPLGTLPAGIRPVLGGLFCGGLGLVFPQVLFFGYSTLDALLAMGAADGIVDTQTEEAALLASSPLGSTVAGGIPGTGFLTLLAAKIAATSVCLGSGLVGGTFAPSLFFGAVLGAAYQASAGVALNAAAATLSAFQISIGVEPGAWGVLPQLTVADAPAYATVGAAAVLASVFRAPLTAALLLFELTRGYDIVLPLLTASGVGALVAELLTRQFSEFARLQKRSNKLVPEECEVDNEMVCKSEEAEEEKQNPRLPEECILDNEMVCKSGEESK